MHRSDTRVLDCDLPLRGPSIDQIGPTKATVSGVVGRLVCRCPGGRSHVGYYGHDVRGREVVGALILRVGVRRVIDQDVATGEGPKQWDATGEDNGDGRSAHIRVRPGVVLFGPCDRHVGRTTSTDI